MEIIYDTKYSGYAYHQLARAVYRKGTVYKPPIKQQLARRFKYIKQIVHKAVLHRKDPHGYPILVDTGIIHRNQITMIQLFQSSIRINDKKFRMVAPESYHTTEDSSFLHTGKAEETGILYLWR